MKATTVLAPAALMAASLQPAQADIGRGIGLAVEFFAGGIAELAVEIFGKRSLAAPLARRQGPPEGVPEFEFERCREEIEGQTVTATSPADDAVQFSGVPPTCMNLANVLVGDGTGPFALPCGSDCLIYEGLSPEQFDELVSALQAI